MQLTASRALRALIATTAATACLATGCSSNSSHPSTKAASATSTSAGAAAKGRGRPACPLTGVPATRAEKPGRVALAVKVDNVAPAMPQAGLDHADIVVEELVEGGLTRLLAVFQCDAASSVGPIRSARTSDADLLALLHGSVFGYSGANPAALPPIVAHGHTVLISNDALPQYFHLDSSRPAPHDVLASTTTLLKAGLSRRHGLKAPKPLFRYGAVSQRARPAKRFGLRWPASTAEWTWSGGHWLRTQNGTPDKLADGHRVSAADVVVLGVTIGSTGLRDVLGNASPLDETVGHNPAWVFRDGSVVSGSWHRSSVTSRIRLRDRAGHQIRLHPGRTWIELLPRPGTPAVG